MAYNVLVVDDSAVMRGMILKALRLSGVELGEVYQAGNGQEGLDVLDRHWVDIVFADIHMPVMSGEEMVQNIQARPDISDVPIVIISSDKSQTRIDALEKQGIRYICKPFTPETIRKVVRETLGAYDEPIA